LGKVKTLHLQKHPIS